MTSRLSPLLLFALRSAHLLTIIISCRIAVLRVHLIKFCSPNDDDDEREKRNRRLLSLDDSIGGDKAQAKKKTENWSR
jgi:hypothetical protein